MHRSPGPSRPLLALTTVALVFGLLPGWAPAAAASNAACTFRVINTPAGSARVAQLFAVSGTGPNDIWAVGGTGDGFGGRPLIEHWNGTAWRVVNGPQPSATSDMSMLFGVKAIAPDDAWAVGVFVKNMTWVRSRIEHWDGTRWSVVRFAANAPDETVLTGVDAVAANDVWAVGSARGTGTVTGHWDGTAWQLVASPNPNDGPKDGLATVTALGPNRVYAAGFTNSGYSRNRTGRGSRNSSVRDQVLAATGRGGSTSSTSGAIVERWNGSAWKALDVSSLGGNRALQVAPGANGLWVAGIFDQNAMTARQDGAGWAVVQASSPTYIHLGKGIAQGPDGAMWLAGEYRRTKSPFTARTLIDRWDGTAWATVASPNVGMGDNTLNAVTVVGGRVWAVGQATLQDGVATLIERGC